MTTPPIALSVPPRTLAGVTFTDGTLEDLGEWLERLPADPVEAARQLRNGLMELNRAEGYFTARFPELELVRPRVRTLCRSLVADGRARLQRVQDVFQPCDPFGVALRCDVIEAIRVGDQGGGHGRVPPAAGPGATLGGGGVWLQGKSGG